MKEQLALLIELQKIETTASRVMTRKRELPGKIDELETKLTEISAAAEDNRAQLENLKKQRKDKDNQLRTSQETLKRSRDRLLEVKTNKEYQSMLKEIENIEIKNSQMEDEIILLLEELDTFEKEVKAREAELAGKRRLYEEEKVGLAEEMNSITGELDLCTQKGEELRIRVPSEVLRKYEQVKNLTRGIAVVSVWKEICGGCHMSIPPQLYNELQKTSNLITCPHCSRILYWENKNN